MKIATLSDTHYGNANCDDGGRPFSKADHRSLAAQAHDHKPDVLIVSGDVADTSLGSELLQKFFNIYRNPHGASIFVPGNHDMWCYKTIRAENGDEFTMLNDPSLPGPDEKYAWYKAEAEKNGWVMLVDHPWEKDGVWIAGNMGWYDYSSIPTHIGLTPEWYEKRRAWPDYHQMGFNEAREPFPMLDFCRKRMAELRTGLSLVPAERKALLVVTHFVGFRELMGPKIDNATAYFGNYNMGKMILAHEPNWYFCGHTHDYAYAKIHGMQAINNGSGYGRGSKRFDVVEI